MAIFLHDTVDQDLEIQKKSGPYVSDALTSQVSEDQGEYEDATPMDLHRGLKSRHITMIALGGAIGTGLIIGSGSGLAQAGPVGLLFGYSFTGVICYIVMTALGEMATWLPLGSGFTAYATRFVDPALGFSLGWCYLCKYVLSTANQLTSMALVLQYWIDRDKVNPGVFIAVFWVVIVLINYFGVRLFGEAEFWLSSLKILILCGVIILSIILVSGGGPSHEVIGFKYWVHPGPIKPYIMSGAPGRFLSVWNSLTSGVFAYLGTELVGVTVGEARNPRKTIPRAIKLTFWRISFFYIVTIFFLGMLVPYNSPKLAFANKQGKTAAASPFVVAIQLAGIKTLPGIMNGCILIFNFSAANSDLYIASRTLYGLSLQRYAPAIFSRTDRHKIPIWSLVLASMFALLAFMNVSTSSKVVFGYFVNLSTTFGILTWITLLVSHIAFVKARKAQGVPDTEVVYKAPFGIWGSYTTLAFCTLICLTKGFPVFVDGFDYKNFITDYLAIPIYLGCIFGWKWWHKTKGRTPLNADIFTGKDKIDREEAKFLAEQAEKPELHHKLHILYKRVIGWLF